MSGVGVTNAEIDEGAEDRELPAAAAGSRGVTRPIRASTKMIDRDLEHEPEPEQEPGVEGPVLVDLRHELHVRPAEAARGSWKVIGNRK